MKFEFLFCFSKLVKLIQNMHNIRLYTYEYFLKYFLFARYLSTKKKFIWIHFKVKKNLKTLKRAKRESTIDSQHQQKFKSLSLIEYSSSSVYCWLSWFVNEWKWWWIVSSTLWFFEQIKSEWFAHSLNNSTTKLCSIQAQTQRNFIKLSFWQRQENEIYTPHFIA